MGGDAQYPPDRGFAALVESIEGGSISATSGEDNTHSFVRINPVAYASSTGHEAVGVKRYDGPGGGVTEDGTSCELTDCRCRVSLPELAPV
jgi:hypothetical protein